MNTFTSKVLSHTRMTTISLMLTLANFSEDPFFLIPRRD